MLGWVKNGLEWVLGWVGWVLEWDRDECGMLERGENWMSKEG